MHPHEVRKQHHGQANPKRQIRLKRDLVIEAGTLIENNGPLRVEYGSYPFEHLIELGTDHTAALIIPNGHLEFTAEWLEVVDEEGNVLPDFAEEVQQLRASGYFSTPIAIEEEPPEMSAAETETVHTHEIPVQEWVFVDDEGNEVARINGAILNAGPQPSAQPTTVLDTSGIQMGTLTLDDLTEMAVAGVAPHITAKRARVHHDGGLNVVLENVVIEMDGGKWEVGTSPDIQRARRLITRMGNKGQRSNLESLRDEITAILDAEQEA